MGCQNLAKTKSGEVTELRVTLDFITCMNKWKPEISSSIRELQPRMENGQMPQICYVSEENRSYYPFYHVRQKCSSGSQGQPEVGGSLQDCARASRWWKVDNGSRWKDLLLSVLSSQSSRCPELDSISIGCKLQKKDSAFL